MKSTGPDQYLGHDEYPGLFQAADETSLHQQHTYLRAIRFRLILTVLAAALAAFPLFSNGAGIDPLAAGVALAFTGVMALELGVAGSRPDRTWYESRALAESIKTLTWRYVAGSAPFTSTCEHADEEFLDRLRRLQRDMPEIALPSTATNITDGMRALRQAPLDQRKEAYRTGRVVEQQTWYARKAGYHRRHARVLRTVMLTMEVLGIAGALTTALGVLDVDIAGIVAAVISALAAWNSTRQHDTTATAYTMASHELGMIRDQLSTNLDEQQWSAAVADAEAAISREHTMWHANRTG